MRKHPYGRVDQLEDRYLGMVEAPSSNLGTSTFETVVLGSICGGVKNNKVVLSNGCHCARQYTQGAATCECILMGGHLPTFLYGNLLISCQL